MSTGRAAVPSRDAATLQRPDLLILLGLAVITFWIYAQVIGHHFVSLDDERYIVGNPIVNRGVTSAGVAWAFTTFYEANWHPLTWISHMIDSQFFGLNAGAHLLINALFHVANTLLVFWFLLRTTHARWPSAFVAALFALHPLHVESVAWASERKDTLSTFFGLLSLIAYVCYAEAPSVLRYASVAIALALGLMAKPMLVTWPFILLLLDYWPLGRWQTANSKAQRLILEKLPLLAIAAASCVITMFAQASAGAVRTFNDVSVATRLSNAVVAYAKYLLLTFWPHDLAVYYPSPATAIPVWQIIGAALLVIGITAFCLFEWKRRPYLIVGWLWFLGTLVPVIGLVQVGAQAMADRYFYIPSIGLFVALVFGLAEIARQRRVAPSFSAAIAGGILLVLATLTNAQIHYWNDSVSLFTHSLAVTADNVPIENSLGYALRKSGRLDEAGEHLEKALQIKPDDYESLLNLGLTRYKQGRFTEAAKHYQAGVHAHPDRAQAHDLLGMALAMQNQNEAALEEMRRASELAPQDPDIRNDFALALARLGRFAEAIDQFQQALRLNPNNAEAHANLGLSLLALGKPRESIPELQVALQLKPDLKAAEDGLRRAQAQLK